MRQGEIVKLSEALSDPAKRGMTELQIRMWTLWMADEFGGFDTPAVAFNVAADGAGRDMQHRMRLLDTMAQWRLQTGASAAQISLLAWMLSEREA